MNRYALTALGSSAAALVAAFGFVVLLMRGNLDEARERTNRTMLAMASFVAGELDNISASDDAADRRLADLCRATGFERIVIADSLGLVLHTSQSLISRGEDIRPYLVDALRFDSTAADRRSRFTDIVPIAGVSFASLYYPVSVGGEPAIAVIESNQSYIASVQRFRATVMLLVGVLASLFAALIAWLVILGRRAEKALTLSRRNERLAFLGRTAAELAHELKNPLAIIKSSVDVARRKFDPDRTYKAFDFMSDEVMRLSRMIGDILGFSRERPMASEPIDLAETLAQIAADACCIHTDMTVEVHVAAGTRITGDAEALRQIVENLIRNAAAALGGKGRVSIGAEIEGGCVRLLVADDGPGVPEEIRGALFEPFVSGNKSGTGLGLAIVKTLCERQGWSVRLAKSRPGETVFEVCIGRTGA